MIELGKFTSAIELAATLNILYIAVEISKSYSSVIIQHIVKINDFVKQCEEECYAHLDEETLNNIPDNIAGKNTKKLREELRISINKEKEVIGGMKKHFYDLMSERLKPSSVGFSCVSLYLFLYCIFSLFYSGIQNEHIIIDVVWLLFTALSYVIVLVVSLFDGFTYQRISLKRILLLEIILSIISCITIFSIYFCKTGLIQQTLFINNYLTTSVLMTIFLPYVHFLIYTIKTYSIVKDLKSEMTNHVKKTKLRCLDIESKINNFNSFKSTYEQLEISLPDE